MRMLVLGAGLQGSACAFDLLNNASVERVLLADSRAGELPSFLTPHSPATGWCVTCWMCAMQRRCAPRWRNATPSVSAIPYYFNFPLAQLAVESGVHFADLGGNTDIVRQQKTLDAAAKAKGVSVVPDTGLAPGMVNVIAQHGIDQFDTVDSVKLVRGRIAAGIPNRRWATRSRTRSRE